MSGISVGGGVGVVTIVAGRRGHLAQQLEGLRRQECLADELVIVRMDRLPVEVPAGVAGQVTVLDLPLSQQVEGRLSLAAARNLGVRALESAVVIMLDVDCIPGARLVGTYLQAAGQVDGLLCGALRYLEPGHPRGPGWTEADLRAASTQHAGRPITGPGQLLREDRHELAWTTSLALRRDSFDRVGGFDERFSGYGGEDTDFAVRAKTAGLGVWWSDDAVAFHQHHASQNPPVQHLADIVRNAGLFAELHGWYPMEGWLTQFQSLGLIDYDPAAGLLEVRAGPVNLSGVTHLVIGPADHGVVRFGRRLAELMGSVPVQLESAGHATAAVLADRVRFSASVHLQYTDALYGAQASEAACAFVELRDQIEAPVTVTLHDLPDPNDEPGRYARRAESYRQVVRAVDAVAVSSRHELDLLKRLLGPLDGARGPAGRVVPLPIEPPSILPPGARPAPLAEVAVFGFLYPGKGHDDVIRAMSGLPSRIRFTALGRTADGHDDLRGSLADLARALGRPAGITGFVPDRLLNQRLRQVAVPVVPTRTISALGSINTWISAGRRPLAAAGPYTREFAERYPGSIHLYRPGQLAALIRAMLARPHASWLTEPLPAQLGGTAVAAGYAGLVRDVQQGVRAR